MAVQIQQRHGTAAAWTAANPVLAEGELGCESDTFKLKMGNGVLAWNSLSYLGGGVSDGDKGDITVTASGATWTIDAGAVTYSKLQNVSATSRILGRKTAGAGVVEELTADDVDGMRRGTVFPGSPTTNQLFFRTDRGMEYYYDGTRWLSSQLLIATYPEADAAQPFAATTLNNPRGALFVPSNQSGIWLVDALVAYRIQGGGTALGASHNWVVVLMEEPGGVTLATVNINSGASAVWRSQEVAIGALWGGTDFALEVDNTKTGTPGTLYVIPMIRYRYVG